ncbi:phosphonate ABC transporter substrate-binding protein [Mesorhizobium sp. M4B.F.Ca.ET.169.01.1.1]|uniref:phosphate/phosphite/phosphonate ABC transporter substrate-binding protein n=1 Tax=unclassified Mesorhizobium TaxID=325217 RepID=UPI000FCBACEC|nr:MULTISPECIES: PhnD/SsuA/transferrin family substrate-binding protein [unclassified Mesorhizobium]RUW24875.1 phosphonate ABC transporter substrate-binding protein [Mesorhizobium sp. M4B.F.Ca.ET.013.02.1.1]RVD45927.1 phosphonate ABC transporter substrate-binding protein [Mesorhizobium sp. M4B.F.Ca.ET.019.03.1.1]TGT44670.1 phosphonate ABC transporter substrate-binding protein [Mesorhizobium sp. M4B.F.Ca.ET.169.01.1.1]
MAALALLAASWPDTASADWRDDIGTFRVGIVAEPGAGNTVPGLALLTDAYTKALGMKVEFVVARDYRALIEAQVEGRIQYAVYSAVAYATASERCGCVEPLVAPVDTDGAAGIRSLLVTRDGKVSDLAAMPGHRIAMAPADSVGGSLLPLAGLTAAGVGISEDSPYLVHAGTAAAAEAMLVDGEADALFGWEAALADGNPAAADSPPALPAGQPAGAGDHSADPNGTMARLEAAGVSKAALRIVWTSGLLRYGPHAVRSDLDPEAKRRLTVFLTNLKSMTPDVYDLLETTHSGGFTVASQKDYAMAAAIVRMVSGKEGGQ